MLCGMVGEQVSTQNDQATTASRLSTLVLVVMLALVIGIYLFYLT